MYSIDSNIFIYAAVKSSPFQKQAESFLNRIFSGEEPCFLCWEALHAFVRITTSLAVFERPMPFTTACAYVERILELPQVELLTASRDSFEIFRNYQKAMSIKGNLVTDAVIASQLEAAGIKTIYTNDRDFNKFTALKPKNPFA